MRFIVQPHSDDDEEFIITDLRGTVPDLIIPDADQDKIEKVVRKAFAQKLVRLLNRHWDTENVP